MSPAKRFAYLDWAATAPLCDEAAEAMRPFMQPGLAGLESGANANANALYAAGRDAFRLLEDARRTVADALGARRSQEVVFTSGATEADNAAVLGLALAAAERKRAGGGKPHVVTTSIEHDAVHVPAARLEALGFDVTYLEPVRQGFVEVRALEAALRDDTCLVSVQAANSETGAVHPIAELAAVAHERGALFHTDAVQALGKMPLSVDGLGVDAASFSSHKVGGPKGVGCLYVRARTPFAAQMLGGGQESGRRSGTQNVCGAVGFAAAAAAAARMAEDEQARLMRLRDLIYARAADMPDVECTVDVEAGSRDYLPNIAHLLVRGLESETLILRLDSMGVAVSGGSACSSHSLLPSRVLTSMGISGDRAQGALRVSMGRLTTEDDVRAFLEALPRAMAWER